MIRAFRRAGDVADPAVLTRLLKWRLLSALGVLATLSVAAYVLFVTTGVGGDRTIILVNELGRQRMLAARVAATVMQLPYAQDAQTVAAIREAVRRDLAAMEATMTRLEILPLALQDQVHRLRREPPHAVDARFEAFAGAARDLINRETPDSAAVRDMEDLLHPLVDGYEAVVALVAETGAATMRRMLVIATVGEVLYLALLSVLALRVMVPLAHRAGSAVAKARTLQAFQRSVITGLADGIVVMDRSGRAELLNPAARRIFGIPDDDPEAVVTLTEHVPAAADMLTAPTDSWTRRKVDGQRRDGTPLHLEITARPIHDRRTVVMVRDITDQREAEARIRSFYDVLEQSPVSIVITDADGVIEYVNPRFTEVTGYTAEEAVGRTPAIVKSGLTPREVYARLWSELRAGRQWRCEILNRRKNGELFWEFQAISPLRDSRGRIVNFLAVKEDITKQKEIQRAMVEAMEEAYRANRAKSDFLAGMSHELRTPLNAIIGYAELMTLEPAGPLGSDTYREYLSAIYSSGQHLLHLINDLLDLSKVEAGKMELAEETVTVGDVVAGAVLLVAERAERKGVILKNHVRGPLPPVRADKLRLRQILLNLLSNAVKFTPSGRHVEVTADLDQKGGMRIVVRDEGCGISEEDLQRVLQPFGQARNPLIRTEEGTGLGLPLARQFARLHGGDLILESREGVGTTATVLLPPVRVAVWPALAKPSV